MSSIQPSTGKLKKRILIDATTVGEKMDGLSQYIINLLLHIPKYAFEIFDFSVLLNPKRLPAALSHVLRDERLHTVYADVAPIGPLRDVQMFFYWRKAKKEFDLFHCTSNHYPLCVRGGFVTIHDITFRTYFDEPWWTFKMAGKYVNFIIGQSLKRASSVIAVSKSTKQMLLDAYQPVAADIDKIKVIYEGWEHLAQNNTVAQEVPAAYGNYLFYAGSMRKHKNLNGLLRAFQSALKALPPSANLVISGQNMHLDKDTALVAAEINREHQRVFFTGYVSTDALKNLFRNCSGFVFPSLSEGFGLPVLEAFHFKKPLLASEATSLPEIAGDAAIYFDPESIPDIRRAIIYFYENPQILPALVLKGSDRLSLFSWKRTAQETIDLYKDHFQKI